MLNPSQPERASFRFSWVALALLVVTTSFLGGCASMGGGGGETSNYHVPAYAPINKSDVHVYVSLDARMVYVMEGNRALLVTPCSIGVSGNATPTGNFSVTEKDATKRSGEYGFWTNGGNTYEGSSTPRSHGCLRIHKNVSVKFSKLVEIGTPVTIRDSLPYDSTLGRAALHPSDYKDPDPPASFMISPDYFHMTRDSELLPASQAPTVQ